MKKNQILTLLFFIIQLSIKAQPTEILSLARIETQQNNLLYFPGEKIMNISLLIDDSTVPIKNRAYYMQKSKQNRSTGFILLGVGTGLIATGIIIEIINPSNFDEVGTGFIVGGLGLLTVLGSIPCFISSASNNKKAKLAITKTKPSFGIPLQTTEITGVTLKIPLGK